MEIFYTPQKQENLSIALGFFDGIHKGHQKVIENAVDFAKKNNTKSAVISFVEHPTCFLLGRKPEYIISLNDKIEKIKNLEIDYLYLLTFDKNLAQMSKEDYFNFVCKMTAPKSITTGFNHYFAKNKEGNTDFLSEICEQKNIVYQKIEPIKLNNTIISSSEIRKSIIDTNFDKASQMLDYQFYIKNKVIQGKHVGRTLGFKTINTIYPENIIKLPFGIYCSKVEFDNKVYNSATNWGIKPTVSDKFEPIMETFIFDFDENIYDKEVKISFYKKIRDEKKFDTLSDLQLQISKDVEFCKNYFNDNYSAEL